MQCACLQYDFVRHVLCKCATKAPLALTIGGNWELGCMNHSQQIVYWNNLFLSHCMYVYHYVAAVRSWLIRHKLYNFKMRPYLPSYKRYILRILYHEIHRVGKFFIFMKVFSLLPPTLVWILSLPPSTSVLRGMPVIYGDHPGFVVMREIHANSSSGSVT